MKKRIFGPFWLAGSCFYATKPSFQVAGGPLKKRSQNRVVDGLLAADRTDPAGWHSKGRRFTQRSQRCGAVVDLEKRTQIGVQRRLVTMLSFFAQRSQIANVHFQLSRI